MNCKMTLFVYPASTTTTNPVAPAFRHRSLGHTHTLATHTPSNTQHSGISHGRPVPPLCAHLLNSSFQVSFSDMLFVCCCRWLPSLSEARGPFS